jgi:hypothetical protein
MMEFIVLGLVPGTTIQLSFLGVLVALGGFVSVSLWSFRAVRSKQSLRTFR